MMRAKLFRENNTIKRIAASLIIFLLSGLFLLFCCHLPIAEAANQETESCPLAKSLDSCHKTASENNSNSSAIENTSQLDCCRMLSQIFSKARKIEKIQEVGATAQIVKKPVSNFSFIKRAFKKPEVFQTFAPDRGKTHLKNCVFRI